MNEIWGVRIGRASAALCAALMLSACDDLSGRLGGGSTEDGAAPAAQGTRTVERELEAPDVFSVKEAGLWDGRPSLGGVWVAHPDVKEPERVIIRNPGNGNFVVGALFRRERANPGPRLQVSSDAASELGMLAGAPVELDVTALRRQEVAVEETVTPPQADPSATSSSDVAALETPDAIEEGALDPVEVATAALETTPEPESAPTSRLSKPFIQVGIFSVEANANKTARQMRSAGMIPTIRKGETSGKPFWRVIVGPARTAEDRKVIQEKIRAEGFGDAYAVTN